MSRHHQREQTSQHLHHSRYAFATVHIHGATYKESGLLTAAGKASKNKEEILKLLEAVWLPKEVAILHCTGHRKGNDRITQGNHLADEAVKAAASKETDEAPSITMALTPPVEAPPPKYTERRKTGPWLKEPP